MFLTKWSDEEDNFLRKNYEKGDMADIMKNLSRRTESAIRKRAAGLKLHRRSNDSLNNDQLILKQRKNEEQLIVDKLETLYNNIENINVLSPEFENYISKIDILEIKLLAFK